MIITTNWENCIKTNYKICTWFYWNDSAKKMLWMCGEKTCMCLRARTRVRWMGLKACQNLKATMASVANICYRHPSTYFNQG
jgi:hypothetical protein